jgi:cysteinyl-tRNA synthetase
LDFTRESLENAKKTRRNIIKKITTHLTESSDATLEDFKNLLTRFKPREFYTKLSESIADDLDTVKTLAAINTALKIGKC